MTTALLLIDIQQGFDDPAYWGARNNPDAEANAGRLLEKWRASGRPVFHVRHASTTAGSPLRLESPGFAFHAAVVPRGGEPEFVKSVNSGFIGTDLEARLRAGGIEKLVIAGLTSPHCVSTTTRMAANLGFETIVVSDATAAFATSAEFGWLADAPPADPETIHNYALANLAGEFATIRTTQEIIDG